MKFSWVLLAASLLAVVVFAVEATENPMRRGECKRQMRMMEDELEMCQLFMTGRHSRPTREARPCYSAEECLRGCCMAMKEMEDECACKSLKMMVREQGRMMEDEEMMSVMRMAKQIPSRCGISDMRCAMDRVFDL